MSREFYVNDAGGQVDRFAASIAARMTGAELPEDGYEGEYVVELGERLREEGVDPEDAEALGRRGVELMVEAVRATLDRFGVGFDTWFSERDLYDRGEVEAALGQLREGGHTYESDGALWLRTTEFGDDKDRVLIRAGGEPTYLAADVAYHWDKLERGFGRLIDVLGADHHGYVARLRAAIEALGADPGHFEALIMRLVHVVEGGERTQMSKRSGDFVSLDELIDDIGVDAARWFMLWRSHDTTVDLDLDLARRQSNENPVYYVQYAHARIASILRKAGEGTEASADERAASAPSRWSRPSERWSSGCWSSRRRCARRPPSAPRTGSAPTRPRSRPTSTPSTATARWSARRARGSSRSGWPSACSRSARSPGRWACWESRPPSGCDARRRRKPPVLATLAAPPNGPPRIRRADFEAFERPARRAGRVPGGDGDRRGRRQVGRRDRHRDHRRRDRQAGGAASSATSPLRRSPRRSGWRPPPGLHEYLLGDASAPQILQSAVLAGPKSRGAESPLVCVVAGRPAADGAALLASEGFRHAISKLRNAYELVVLDGPPLGSEDEALADGGRRVRRDPRLRPQLEGAAQAAGAGRRPGRDRRE